MTANSKQSLDKLAPIAAALLLILTAWDNAMAMAIVSAIALVVCLIVFHSDSRASYAAATIGFLIAVAVAYALQIF